VIFQVYLHSAVRLGGARFTAASSRRTSWFRLLMMRGGQVRDRSARWGTDQAEEAASSPAVYC